MSSNVSEDALVAWQKHVVACRECGTARDASSLCVTGRNFWRVPGSATMPLPVGGNIVPLRAGVQAREAPQPVDISSLVSRVAERVVARTASGVAVAVPIEKTSQFVEVSPKTGVTLRMPERDLEVYSVMKTMIRSLLDLATRLAMHNLAWEELRRAVRGGSIDIGRREEETALSEIAVRTGAGSSDDVYGDFLRATGEVAALGDVIGRCMAVDNETRAIMREARTLSVAMQGEAEREMGALVFGPEMAAVGRQMRMLAVSLQGELERRLGT